MIVKVCKHCGVKFELPYQLPESKGKFCSRRCAGRQLRTHDRDAVFAFIIEFKKQHDGNSPSLRQIMAEIGISSTSSAAYVITSLVREKRLRRTSEGLEVVHGKWIYVNPAITITITGEGG